MAIEISEYHDEVLEELVDVLGKNPWNFAPGRGQGGEFRFHKQNKAKLGERFLTYNIGLTSDNANPEIKIYDSSGILFLRLLIDRQTGRLDGWDWDSNTRCQMTSPHQYEATKFIDWPKAILNYADRVVGRPDAKQPGAIYMAQKPAESKVEITDISRTLSREPNTKNPAIAVFGCDRPEYLRRTLDSLKANKEAHDFDFYYFQDRPPLLSDREAQELVEEQVADVLSAFPKAQVIIRKVNWGCGRNLIDGRRQLFDNLAYDRVYVFEDDMIVTLNYIRFCEDVWAWADRKGYQDIGTVQGWSQCRISEPERQIYYDHCLEQTLDTFWGYSMSLKAWDYIRDDVYRYEQNYLQCEYQKRNEDAISAFMRRTYQSLGRRENAPRLYPDNSHFLSTATAYFNGPPTGQDGITNLFLYVRGFTRLAPVISRSRYIGEEGINFNPAKYRMQGYGSMIYRDLDNENCVRRDFLEMLNEMPDSTLVSSISDIGTFSEDE